MDTRMIFLGDADLATGFRLAGYEVFPDADENQLETLLKGLHAARQPAFVVLDQKLSECDCGVLKALREEGGRILITQVPDLRNPDLMRSSVDERIAQMMGQPEGLA